jgi:hypothetical protein
VLAWSFSYFCAPVPWSARKGFADRASQEGELFGVNPARLISMRDAGASLVCM